MARQWNMATNIGAFMSVNSKKLNWQLGPQVNYQLLSSYTDAYPVKEHYINYGIKLAVGIK
jgi:SH3-like domain-containing protein